MSDTRVASQDQAVDDVALYACVDDTPAEARIRQLLVRQFAVTSFAGAKPNDHPHLAADTAMRIMVPILAERLAVIEGAARASERAACVQQLRGGQHHLAAMALEASGPDAIVARDAAVVRPSGR